MRTLICLLVTLLVANNASAQSVCIPLPRLLTMTPMGGQAGTSVDVAITGDSLDEAGELVFTNSSLKAVAKKDASGKIVPNVYVVSIAADCPSGIHEARVMSRLGVSSTRVFSVGTLPEVTRTIANNSLATAMELQVDSLCNANVNSKAVDHYTFAAKQGERILVHCASRTIDSKLNAVLIVGDDAGRDLKVERRSGMIDFHVPSDGKYTIKIHDLTFNGGPAYFYRLSLKRLSDGEALPTFPSTQLVSAFSWPPEGLAAKAATVESEPNNDQGKVQSITLPCDIAGSFYPAADVDTFEFSAKKNEVWWIEVASERLGCSTDPAAIIQRVEAVADAASAPKLTDVIELNDIASPVKVSSNGYAYDGPPFNGGSTDILGKLEIKEDGVYRLQLSDLFGGTRNDPSNVYRLIIRKAQPDFALVAWGLHMELRNGDRAALSKPIALRAGQTIALEVVTLRRDGFDGPIELSMQNLPAGVTAQGITIPSGKSRGVMLLTADADGKASPALSNAQFIGTAQIDGKAMTRNCRLAEMTWPVADSWSEIPRPRLVIGVPISVSAMEQAPLSIAAKEKNVIEVTAGQKVVVPIQLTRRTEFSGSVIQLRTFGEVFERAPQFSVPLTADSAEATFDTATLKAPAGEYVVAFYGGAVARYSDNPAAVDIAKLAQNVADENAKRLESEVKTIQEQLTAVAADQKAATEQKLAELKMQLQTAQNEAKAAADRVKTATERAKAKDTVDIVVSEPIRIRVK